MDTKETVSATAVDLALEFARLWEHSPLAPDAAVFLKQHPEASLTERLQVLSEDLRLRWKQGCPLPVKAYLKEFPDIAGRVDLVRLLVAADQRSRREFGPFLGALGGGLPQGGASTKGSAQEFGTRGEPETIPEDATQSQSPPAAGPGPETTIRNAPHDTKSIDACSDQLGFQLATDVERLTGDEPPLPLIESRRFTLLGQIGAGGMGVVYEAYDQDRGEFVALKTMRQVDQPSLVRFKHEFRALCDITHPNLVNLYQLFALDEPWFFTMELVDGCDFLTYVRGKCIRESLPETRLSHQPPCSAAPQELEAAPGGCLSSRAFEEQRLRAALAQLAEGVHALHQAGKLHRDIKPTNVLVDGTGRLVLLDFGLTADLEACGEHRPADRQVVGTLAHMAPEQAVGRPVSAASDWYSVGIMLYQALTGRLPFQGSFDEVVHQKQSGSPVSPARLVEGLPEDLVELCLQLLQPDPADRPSGQEVRARLRGTNEPDQEPAAVRPSVPLIGREWHRHVLESAYAALLWGRSSAVFIRGRTGTGKTALVRTFVDELSHSEDTLVLSGRCYEREWVSYKALDSLVDSLARYLKQRSPRDRARLLPEDAALLSRVFPVLRGLEATGGPRADEPLRQAPHEFRTRVFSVFRDLLARLGEEKHLVLMIDDLQWGDADSALLLADLLYGPCPPRMLFLGCYRLEDADQSRLLPILHQARDNPAASIAHHDLAVEPLTLAESRELARSLIGLEETTALAMAHLVAREAEGNPLFINELARHVRSGGVTGDWSSPAGLDLEAVLWTRIQAQPPDAQRLLEVVSVAGRPIRETLAFRAAELRAGGRAALGSLRSSRLIRNLGADHVEWIETYHDRIRATVREHIAPETLRGHYRRLAELLEATAEADPEVLADHYQGAGDPDRACEYLVWAADKAVSALAFDHAARLYQRALELHRGPMEQEARIRRSLGEALSNSGRGAEAAASFLRAARSAAPLESLELRRLASTQLLLSGQVQEGLTLLRTVLRPAGLRMPSGPRAAWLSLIRHRALLRVRGMRFRRREASQISARELSRIDLCWSAVAGLNGIDPLLAADFQARGLLLALRAGEPFRLARALAMEAAHHATTGNPGARRAATLLKAAETLKHSLHSPELAGTIQMVRGTCAFMLGQWAAAQDWFEKAGRHFRDHGAGATWERNMANTLNLLSLLFMGRISELRERWSTLTREAQGRGDQHAVTTLTTSFMAMVRLADDDLGHIEEDIETAMAPWSGHGFLLQHASAFRSLVHLELYRGRTQQAWKRLTRVWPDYARSRLFRIQLIRIQLLELRARCNLALAECCESPATLLAAVEKDARRLVREGQPWAAAHAVHLRAGIAARRGEVATAVHHLTEAAERYDQAGMPLNAAVMRYRSGEVQPGDEGRNLIGRAERWIRSQSIRSPRQWAQMTAPGFSSIATCKAETSY